jgi:mycothiol system anti-sigma-R factor
MNGARDSRLDRYTCEETLRRLADYLDHELSEAEMRLVREHIDTCAACAREHGFEAAVVGQVRAKLHRISAPSELVDRLTAALAAERRASEA